MAEAHGARRGVSCGVCGAGRAVLPYAAEGPRLVLNTGL